MARRSQEISSSSHKPTAATDAQRPVRSGFQHRWLLTSLAVLAIAVCLAMSPWSSADVGTTNHGFTVSISARQDDDQESRPGQEDLTLEEFMQIKLLRSQDVMEGMATRNFTLVEEAAKELQKLTEASKWAAHKSPEYVELTKEFQVSVARLEHAAKTENLEGVALRFYDMTTRCIDCHEHLRVIDF